MTKRVLITGATGLIGRGVGAELSGDYEVVYTARNRIDLPINRFFPFDLSQTSQIANFLDQVKPQVVVHTAAVTSIAEVAQDKEYAHRLNVDAVREIALWCNKNEARMIHFSSDFVFEGTKIDYSETDEPNPMSSYGQSKWESEKAIVEALKNHLIIRPILVYGYFKQISRLNFPLLVVSKLRNGQEMHITSDQIRMPTHVSDIAKIVERSLFSQHIGYLHLSGDELINMYEFALRVADIYGLDKSLLKPVETTNEPYGECRPRISGFNLQKAKALFDYQPKSIDKGLRMLTISEG